MDNMYVNACSIWIIWKSFWVIGDVESISDIVKNSKWPFENEVSIFQLNVTDSDEVSVNFYVMSSTLHLNLR